MKNTCKKEKKQKTKEKQKQQKRNVTRRVVGCYVGAADRVLTAQLN
jgi:hypothetical protein